VFTGLEINATSVVMHDGGNTKVYSRMADVPLLGGMVMFKLVSTARWHSNVLS
jgi:hypothetical protein